MMNGRDGFFMKAIKRRTRVGSDSFSAEDDVWDDSVLVEAYNKAVDDAHAKVLQNMPRIPPSSRFSGNTERIRQWKVGDFCRCEFTVDHIYYEAYIVDVIDDYGMCIIKYIGYENEERVHISKLKSSKGEMARTMQMKQAMRERALMAGPPEERQPESGYFPQPGRKKNIFTIPENARYRETASANGVNVEYPTSSHMFKPPLMAALPPPPPPQLFTRLEDNLPESDAMSAMLMSWYMSGYHTGYYQGLRAAKK